MNNIRSLTFLFGGGLILLQSTAVPASFKNLANRF